MAHGAMVQFDSCRQVGQRVDFTSDCSVTVTARSLGMVAVRMCSSWQSPTRSPSSAPLSSFLGEDYSKKGRFILTLEDLGVVPRVGQLVDRTLLSAFLDTWHAGHQCMLRWRDMALAHIDNEGSNLFAPCYFRLPCSRS